MTITSYRIADYPAPLPATVLRDLALTETATIGHYFHDRFMDQALQLIGEPVRIAGTAVTLSLPNADSTLLYYALDRVRPGDVLVIDRGGDNRHAAWGGFMAAVAKARQLAGVIIDGAVTDPAAIRAAGVATWARGVSPITTKLLNLGGSFNHPISCGAVVVNPGDAVLADDCGIVVMAPDVVEGVTRVALADQADELTWMKRVEAGEKLQDMVDIAAMIAERQKKDEAAHG